MKGRHWHIVITAFAWTFAFLAGFTASALACDWGPLAGFIGIFGAFSVFFTVVAIMTWATAQTQKSATLSDAALFDAAEAMIHDAKLSHLYDVNNDRFHTRREQDLYAAYKDCVDAGDMQENQR